MGVTALVFAAAMECSREHPKQRLSFESMHFLPIVPPLRGMHAWVDAHLEELGPWSHLLSAELSELGPPDINLVDHFIHLLVADNISEAHVAADLRRLSP